jgi:glycosyltransferase involved in cell wall biosynthesis
LKIIGGNLTSPVSLDKNFSTTRLLHHSITEHRNDAGTFVCPDLCDDSERERVVGGLRTLGYSKKGYKKSNDQWMPYDQHTCGLEPVALPFFPRQDSLPLISVITVVYNGASYIEESIKSVIGQSYPNIEYILIDGQSNDGTLDVIRKFNDEIDYWVSEKDGGIYDAMNKGVELCRGEWIYFLGSDDKFIDGEVVSTVVQEISQELITPSLVFGKVITNNDVVIDSWTGIKTLLHNTVHHQSCFYHASIFKDYRYDPTLRMISDYEVNLIAYLKRFPFKKIEHVIAMCRDGGISTSKSEYATFMRETNFIRRKHVPRWADYFLKMIFKFKSRLHFFLKYR